MKSLIEDITWIAVRVLIIVALIMHINQMKKRIDHLENPSNDKRIINELREVIIL